MRQMTLVVDDRPVDLAIPDWVIDLESFRRWCDDDDFPEKGRICYLQGRIWIDMSKEQLFTHNDAKSEIAHQLGATDFVNPARLTGTLQEAIIDMTDGGVDHSFECVGNVDLMRIALESTHRGWGQSVVIGVAGAGQELRTRPFQLVTGRVWKGTAFGGVKGRTELPDYVDMYMNGRIELDALVTHVLPHAEVNKAFELLHGGQSIRTVLMY